MKQLLNKLSSRWILSFLFTCEVASAADGTVSLVDLTQKREDSPLYLVFCARDNTASGHAFIVWGKEDVQRQMSTISAYGYYAKESAGSSGNSSAAVAAFFGSVPGELADDAVKGSLSKNLGRLIIKVNKSDYDAAEEVRAKWAQKTDYKVLTQDCVTFVSEAAAAIGLNLPDRSGLDNFPWRYMQKLSDTNNQAKFLDGYWQSNDTDKRFRLEIRRKSCVIIERNATGAVLRKELSLSASDAAYALSRPNDDQVLTFFYQPKLKAQITARNPPASTLALIRRDSQLTGTWRGLVATKDNQANLKDLKLGDPKTFVFDKVDQ